MKDTLWHISWGDGDNFFVVAPDRESAIDKMEEGTGMVNWVVKLDYLYNFILKKGRQEVVEFVESHGMHLNRNNREWRTKLKEWGL